MPAYKSYCWSLGTTSFRMVEFNRKIEQQLGLLKEFWDIPRNSNKTWVANEEIQTAYYVFIKERGFIEDKEAPRKAKDARQKTSGLVDLGLMHRLASIEGLNSIQLHGLINDLKKKKEKLTTILKDKTKFNNEWIFNEIVGKVSIYKFSLDPQN